jgi:DEAD/DEAH box helicase domain-containing protein
MPSSQPHDTQHQGPAGGAQALLARIARGMGAHRDTQIVDVAELPGREAAYAEPHPELPAPLVSALRRRGITRLYSHQVEALERVRRGENVVVATATSSGKTLCYNLPVLETILGSPEARALYIYPINALINDQFESLAQLNLALGPHAVSMGRYTGAVNSAKRREVRARQPNILLTNPEMLHLSLLQWHHLWGSLWRNLAYVVIDEIHTYRGVFGSNVAYLLLRLLRIARHYGANPQFVCCSATIANPQELAERLTSQPFAVVSHDGAASGKKLFVLWNPPLERDGDANVRRSYALESVDLMRHCLRADLNTIVFTRARRLTEQMTRLGQEALAQEAPDSSQAAAWAAQIASYRAGYLAKERESIEARLKSGTLRGVIATNALELGIDIGGLDAAIIAGYPGTIMSTWQQAGRAGRRGRDALVFLVASQNPLDQYYMAHPEQFHAEAHERAIVDMANPFIRLRHLLCAAKELPWSARELAEAPDDLRHALGRLCSLEVLAEHRESGFGARLVYPESRRDDIHMRMSLRSAGQDTYRIISQDRQEIGTIEPPNVFRETHPGAIYQQSDGDYRVVALNRRERSVLVRPESAPHYTRSRSESSLRIVESVATRPLGEPVSGLTVTLGAVLVTETIRSYQELEMGSNRLIRRVNLDQPLSLRLNTTALWLGVSSDFEAAMEGDAPQERRERLGRALHAVEHLLAGLLPLLVMCDRRDVDGHHDLSHPDLPCGAVFLYDAYEGGIGLVEAAYHRIEGTAGDGL